MCKLSLLSNSKTHAWETQMKHRSVRLLSLITACSSFFCCRFRRMVLSDFGGFCFEPAHSRLDNLCFNFSFSSFVMSSDHRCIRTARLLYEAMNPRAQQSTFTLFLFNCCTLCCLSLFTTRPNYSNNCVIHEWRLTPVVSVAHCEAPHLP